MISTSGFHDDFKAEPLVTIGTIGHYNITIVQLDTTNITW